MNTIEVIYLSMAAVSFATSIPQIKQLLVLKKSDELNLFTWTSWAISQITSLAYAIYLKSIPFIVVNIVWTGFYVFMLILIVKYRNTKETTLATELATYPDKS
ncbi:MAG: hypothetical protein ACM3KH_00720 [Thiobacillus sp.]